MKLIFNHDDEPSEIPPQTFIKSSKEKSETEKPEHPLLIPSDPSK